MKLHSLVAALVLAGCCKEQEETIKTKDDRIDKLEAEVVRMQSSIEDYEVLAKELENLKSKLNTAQEILVETQERETQAQQRLALVKDMLAKFKTMIDSGQLSVAVERGKMKLELPSAVLFPSGSATLTEKGMKTLDEVAEVLKQIEGREFQVAGHTDNEPVSKDSEFSSNWILSAARAVAVVAYLQEKGVKPRQLSAAGYSQFQPVSSNKTKQGQTRNRRIEIILMPNLEELPDLSGLEQELGLTPREEVPEE